MHIPASLTVHIERVKEGWFATVPELQGCYTQGETLTDLLENVKDVILLHCSLPDPLDSTS